MENIEKQDISQKIQDYKEIIASFSELLKTENQALTDFNLELVSSLYEKKLQTVMAYRGLVAYFIKNQASLETLNEAEKLDLKSCSQALDELLQENDDYYIINSAESMASLHLPDMDGGTASTDMTVSVSTDGKALDSFFASSNSTLSITS